MGNRLDLQVILETLLGSSYVYFQPPPTITMSYPCIVYQRNNIRVNYADNDLYKFKKQYTITVIDKDPDSLIPDLILQLPLTSFDRHYPADGLNHDVFTTYF